MHPEIGRDVRDRPLALQRETDAALHELVGGLLRARHKNARISFRQDIILTSEPPSNPAWLRASATRQPHPERNTPPSPRATSPPRTARTPHTHRIGGSRLIRASLAHVQKALKERGPRKRGPRL